MVYPELFMTLQLVDDNEFRLFVKKLGYFINVVDAY